ncbi:MAG: peptidoglycan-binding protein [Candidatus Dormibacteraeota bacterium]|nr:peptidoglycan-binding protein [Candidatus Dormibacteraeota bacterium]
MIGFKAFRLATGGAVVGAAAALVALALPSGGSGPLGQVAPRTALAASISCNTTLTVTKGSLLTSIPAAGTSKNPDCVLGVGNQGVAVKTLQSDLNACYRSGLQVDGIYGPKTKAAVTNAQKAANSAGHHISVDGIYGPQTRGAINWPFDDDFHPGRTFCQTLGSAR